MKQIETRTRPRIPAVTCGGSVSGARLDRHLAVLGGPALSAGETEDAAGLMLDLTSRNPERAAPRRTAGVSLFAPLRRLRRSLFGGRR
ncbi:hypothetical protein [Wenjunlia tyrosinilytica]|jgi:hypothetical protein|uniref:Uncharacterized protein n=1 Tax=Wenjunlia tyrosinilytica TaxID=1544741 RepID=A0A917ZWF9_9ACTN|nr:hypothetical protein [Wenjunlia tyrosinilytica]GGO95435.1 hypothetical protein GCM10012280_52620 [Wenjunlia tyrosinilytica]